MIPRKRHFPNKALVIFVIVWISIMYFLSNIRPLAMLTNAWRWTESSQYGFSVEHPAKWVAREYGQSGWRGEEDVILILRSGVDPGFVNVWIQRQEVPGSTVEDVANWGEAYLANRGQNLIEQGEPGFSQIELREKFINGQKVIIRKYIIGGSLTNLDVYIARKNDMIIITLQTSQGQFDTYVEDFMQIVKSFTPMQ